MPGKQITGNEREVIVGNLVRGIQSIAKESSEEVLSIIQQAIGESQYNDYCTGISNINYDSERTLSGTAASTDLTSEMSMTITIYAYPQYDIVNSSDLLNTDDITDANFKEGIKFHRPLIYLAETDDHGSFAEVMPDLDFGLFYLKCGDQIKRFAPYS